MRSNRFPPLHDLSADVLRVEEGWVVTERNRRARSYRLTSTGRRHLGRTMTTMLYDVSATDPATFAAIAAVAVVTATPASVLPALRAVRVDPVTALRAD